MMYVCPQLLDVRYITLLLRIAGDGPHTNAEDARILADDRGSEKLGHVFNVLILKLNTQNLSVLYQRPKATLGIIRSLRRIKCLLEISRLARPHLRYNS